MVNGPGWVRRGVRTNYYYVKEIFCILPCCCLEHKLAIFASQNVYDTKNDLFRYVAYETEAW